MRDFSASRSIRILVTGAVLAAGATALPASAQAQQTAATTTALNLRTGPGVRYEIATTLPEGARVALGGCEAGGWCQVSWEKWNGWVSSRYLTTDYDGRRMMVAEDLSLFPVIDFDGGVDMVDAEIAGTLGTPPGVTPPQRVGNYVGANPTDMRYLDGEVVVGARLPQGVALHDIPDYRDDYAYVNGQIVIVDPSTRAVVYVYG